MDVRRISVLGPAALLIVCSGCLTKADKNGGMLSRSLGKPGQSAATAPLGDARYDDLVREMQEQGHHASVDAMPKSATQKVSGAFKKASASVASALTIKPRVRKAPDPLALDNMPKKIGVDLCFQAGRMAETNGNPAAAIAQYERGLKDNPKHLPTLISLARLYDRQDEFDKAEKLYRQALDAEPDNATAHNDLGLCLARHEQNEAALAELRTAVKLEPNRKLYRNNLATVLVDVGRVDEAWNELNAAHSPAVAHYNLGYLLYHSGDKQRAREEFALAKQADTSLAAAQQMLDQLDAETQGGAVKTQVAMATRTPVTPTAPPAPKAATKIKYRVDDLEPQSTDLDRRVQAQTVVHAPTGLRRTPPTDAETQGDRLSEPVPLTPAENSGAASSLELEAPVMQPPASEFPIRRMSGTLIEEVDDLDLPTPDLLGQ